MAVKDWLANKFIRLISRMPTHAVHPCPDNVYVDRRVSSAAAVAPTPDALPSDTSATSTTAPPRPMLLSHRPPPPESPVPCPRLTGAARPESAAREPQVNSDVRRSLNGVWKSNGASLFACFLCCVNFYTLSRFSLLAYFFKGPFLVQFVILSLVFGVPLLLFLMSVGQYLGSGYSDIWFISPAFRGIGHAFMFTYAIVSIYSSVPISWLFVYFRDSFLATRDTPFRWAYCSLQFNTENCIKSLNASSYEYVGWSVSSYLHGKVLASHSPHKSHLDGGIKLDTAFNVALVWTIVFLALYRGLQGAGRLLVVLGALPLCLYMMVSFRFIETFGNGVEQLFQSTDKPFLLDGTSWLIAARETFIVWTAFGAAALSVCSHNKASQNLIRQVVILFFLVLAVLFLSACFFASAMEAVTRRGLVFTPSSFEKENDTSFVKDRRLLTPTITVSDFKIVSGSNLFLGENLISVKTFDRESHYGIMRFATEIYPAALAIEGPNRISSFWAMAFYLSAILLNLGSLIVIWGTVIDAIVAIDLKRLKMWKPTIAFISSVAAFCCCLPMTTSKGLAIIYYLDFCFASLWWLSLLYLLLVIAILIIRGRPVGTENLVQMLVKSEGTRNWFLPAITFHWNLIVPVSIMILSICFTRSYSPTGLTWTQVVSIYPHWPSWAQWSSIAIQILPLFIVFTYGVFQVTFYLATKQGPIHERLQLLFCPTISTSEMQRRGTFVEGYNPATGLVNPGFVDDPPPKYTPPPSYSTATSRQVRKQLRTRLASSITIDLHNLSHVLSSSLSSNSNHHRASVDSVSTSPAGVGDRSPSHEINRKPSRSDSQTSTSTLEAVARLNDTFAKSSQESPVTK